MKTEIKVTMQVESITEVREALESIATKLCAESELLHLMKDVLETPQYHGVPNAGAMEMLLEQIEEELNEISNQADEIDLMLGQELESQLAEAAAS